MFVSRVYVLFAFSCSVHYGIFPALKFLTIRVTEVNGLQCVVVSVLQSNVYFFKLSFRVSITKTI